MIEVFGNSVAAAVNEARRERANAEKLAQVHACLPVCKACGKEKGRPVYAMKCEDCWLAGWEPKTQMARARAMRDVIPGMPVNVRLR